MKLTSRWQASLPESQLSAGIQFSRPECAVRVQLAAVLVAYDDEPDAEATCTETLALLRERGVVKGQAELLLSRGVFRARQQRIEDFVSRNVPNVLIESRTSIDRHPCADLHSDDGWGHPEMQCEPSDSASEQKVPRERRVSPASCYFPASRKSLLQR